jgi:hypothetical protein
MSNFCFIAIRQKLDIMVHFKTFITHKHKFHTFRFYRADLFLFLKKKRSIVYETKDRNFFFKKKINDRFLKRRNGSISFFKKETKDRV